MFNISLYAIANYWQSYLPSFDCNSFKKLPCIKHNNARNQYIIKTYDVNQVPVLYCFAM
jgi:hypothetical protein